MRNIRQLCLIGLLLFTAALTYADNENDIIIIKRGNSSTTSKAENSKEAGGQIEYDQTHREWPGKLNNDKAGRRQKHYAVHDHTHIFSACNIK